MEAIESKYSLNLLAIILLSVIFLLSMTKDGLIGLFCLPPNSLIICQVFFLSWILSITLLQRYGLLSRRSGIRFPDPPTLEKYAKGIRLCNLLRSTQPNDPETVIEGKMRRVSVKRSRIFQVAPSKPGYRCNKYKIQMVCRYSNFMFDRVLKGVLSELLLYIIIYSLKVYNIFCYF